uniref:p0 protein n=1 Tax=Maize yellow mosaic virus TaxID=1856642 RepID=A0A191T7U7_9VIRU|nr:P0 protein [Maize yellow mosaic virus]
MRCEVNFTGSLSYTEIPYHYGRRLAEFTASLQTIAFCILNPAYDAEALFRSVLLVLPLMLRDLPYTRGFPRDVWSAFARHAIRTGGNISPPPECFPTLQISPRARFMYRDFLQRIITGDSATRLAGSPYDFLGGLESFKLKLEGFCRRVEHLGGETTHATSGFYQQASDYVVSCVLELLGSCLVAIIYTWSFFISSLFWVVTFMLQHYTPHVLSIAVLYILHNALGPAGHKDFWRLAGYDDLLDWDFDIRFFQDSIVQREFHQL